MDPRTLDGNAVAGLLREVFAVEMTTVVATCSTCGNAAPFGAVRAYRGAGTVLRCARCDNVLMKIVARGPQNCVDASGVRAFA